MRLGRCGSWGARAVMVLSLVLVASCTSDLTADEARDLATADKLIEDGSEPGVVTDGEGRRLETYRTGTDESEDPEALAWRLLGRGGDEVARGLVTRTDDTFAAADVVGLDEGFAWVAYNEDPDTVTLVDENGETTTAVVRRRRVPEAGDLLLAGWTEAPILLRGRTPFHLSAGLARTQRGSLWLEIDSDGSLWRVAYRGVLQHSRGGRPWESVRWPGRPSLSFDSESVAVRDGVVAGVVLDYSREYAEFTDVVVREPSGVWRSVGLEGATPFGLHGLEIRADGSLVLGPVSEPGDNPTYVLEPGGTRWERVPLSEDEK